MGEGGTNNEECCNPGCTKNTGPCSPTDHGMAGLVSGALEHTEEDESGADRGVENAEEDQSRNHKGERYFLVDFVAK